MPIFSGAIGAKDLRIGTAPVQRVYSGASLVWERTPLAVSVSHAAVSGQGATDPVTATASGGSGAYTYQWQRVSGSALIQAASPSTPDTWFEMISQSPTRTATWRCVVTDGQHTANSPDVTVTIFGTGNDGPPSLPTIM